MRCLRDAHLGQRVWLWQKKVQESGRGVWGPWWGHEVGACPLGSLCPGKHVNWPWTAVAGRKTAQIGNRFWQGSPLPPQHRYNELSMLCSLQIFMDGVVPQRQGSNTNPLQLAGTGLHAGAITNHPGEFGSPAGILSVWGRAGSHSQHGHLIAAACMGHTFSWETGISSCYLLPLISRRLCNLMVSLRQQ